jgi:hypothetical protein
VADRDARYLIASAIGSTPVTAKAAGSRVRRCQPVTGLDGAWRRMAERIDGAYANVESRLDQKAFARIYPRATGVRVGNLWRRYDPDGIFRPFAGAEQQCLPQVRPLFAGA